MKLEQIGTSTLGKPILVIKMTADARNVPDGTRPALLFSAVNHAREWLAAEQGRRLPIWFAEHKNDPKIKEMHPEDASCGSCRSRTRTATTSRSPAAPAPTQVMCDYRVRSRRRQPLLAQDAARQQQQRHLRRQPGRRRPEPQLPGQARASTKRARRNTFNSETYRGPYALSEPENLAFDRLLRRVKFVGNINYHTDGQLLLTPVSYTTDYAPPDATIFDAMTGTDGDSAVFPYQPQRSSDLYESNGDTIDNAYLNYGIIGWTPEMDTCATGGDAERLPPVLLPGRRGQDRRRSSRRTSHFALNVAELADAPRPPDELRQRPEPLPGQADRGHPADRFDVSYGAPQTIEAIVRKALGPSDVARQRRRPATAPSTIPMTVAPAGERYGEVPGYYFERRRATIPADASAPATCVAGDIVNVIVLAGGQQQEFRYRVASTQTDATKKRVLVVAAEDYTGVSPNVTARLRHRAALPATAQDRARGPPATRSRPTTSTTRRPTAARRTARHPPIKYPTYLGVLSHFDAVVY